jgi:hypothetical protein
VDLLALLVAVAYWPGIAGAATTPRWAVLALMVPWLLHRQTINAVHVAGVAFIAWAALSLLWSASPQDGIGSLFILGLLAMCLWLGGEIHDLRPVYIWAGLGLCVSSAAAVLQAAGFHPVLTNTDALPSGLFVNANFMAEAAALIVVALVAERVWWLIPGLLPALILPQSRTAMLACGVGLMVNYRRHTWVMGGVAVAAVAFMAWYAQTKWGSTSDRLMIWQSALNGVTLFGHGIGSFWTTFPQFDLRINPAAIPEYAHNELLHIAFELGIVGVVLACVFGLTLIGPLDTSRLVLIAVAVEACFEFPTKVPVTGFIAMVAAGAAGRSRYFLCSFLGNRRRTVPAWLEGAHL